MVLNTHLPETYNRYQVGISSKRFMNESLKLNLTYVLGPNKEL